MFQRRVEHGGINRFRHVPVHAGRQTALTVAVHRMRGHRDDPYVAAGLPLALPDGGGRVEAAHFRHLHIHQHHVERLARERGQRLEPIVRDRDYMSPFRQQPDRNALIDDVVFREEHAQ